MPEPSLLYEKRGHIAHITFNRPEVRNALSPEMICRLADAWKDFADDDDMRVALISGAGNKAFTAGADLKTMLPLLTGARPAADEWDERLLADSDGLTRAAMLKDATLYKPIVAAVSGACIGAGSELLQAVDIRIASEDAFFAINEVTLGTMPGGGSAVRLARQIPFCKAMQHLLTGDRFDAREAHQIGFINEVVAPGELMKRAEWFVERIAANSPLAVRKTKETVWRTLAIPLTEGFAIEAENFATTISSEDAKEGARAFAERRSPNFVGW